MLLSLRNTIHTDHGIGDLVSGITQTSPLQDKIFSSKKKCTWPPLNHDRDHDDERSCNCDDRDRKPEREREGEGEGEGELDAFWLLSLVTFNHL